MDFQKYIFARNVSSPPSLTSTRASRAEPNPAGKLDFLDGAVITGVKDVYYCNSITVDGMMKKMKVTHGTGSTVWKSIKDWKRNNDSSLIENTVVVVLDNDKVFILMKTEQMNGTGL